MGVPASLTIRVSLLGLRPVCLTQASLGSGDQIPWGLSGVEEGLCVSWPPVPLFFVHRALYSALTARELCRLPHVTHTAGSPIDRAEDRPARLCKSARPRANPPRGSPGQPGHDPAGTKGPKPNLGWGGRRGKSASPPFPQQTWGCGPGSGR